MAKLFFSKTFIRFFTLSLFLFVGVRIYYRATDDFRLGNISYDMPFHDEWTIPALPEDDQRKLDTILKQEFTYIGKGAQSYAFASDDDRYVIKFFKFKHLRPSWFIDNLPNFWPFKEFRELQQYKKHRKLVSVFNGYHLSYDVHKDESALLYIHLNKTDNLQRKVSVIDKIGLRRQVDLDEAIFVVQEKVKTSRTVIFNELEQGNPKKASEYIRSLFDLYLSEYAKGIYDHDHGVLHNTGFVGEKPIHLDVGKMYRDEHIHKKENSLNDLGIVANKISQKIKERYPAYYTAIAQEIENYISTTFGEPFQLSPLQ